MLSAVGGDEAEARSSSGTTTKTHSHDHDDFIEMDCSVQLFRELAMNLGFNFIKLHKATNNRVLVCTLLHGSFI